MKSPDVGAMACTAGANPPNPIRTAGVAVRKRVRRAGAGRRA
jgi:hypothetical protein